MKKYIIKFAKIFKPFVKELIFKPFNRLTRHSSKTLVLQNLKKCRIPVSQIVDVGVSTSTDELINCFSKLEHLLFEPVKKYHTVIKKNYRRINYQLFKVALSDSKGSAYLIESSSWGNGISTHSSISANPKKIDGKKIIKSDQINIEFLDSYNELILHNCLLKIDVDGFDLEVLKGSKEVLKKASIVIVEATWSTLAERAAFIEKNGFVLYDMADKCLYGNALWQCDLVYVRKDFKNLLRQNINDFNYFLWHEL